MVGVKDRRLGEAVKGAREADDSGEVFRTGTEFVLMGAPMEY